jgi:hypothetical protein
VKSGGFARFDSKRARSLAGAADGHDLKIVVERPRILRSRGKSWREAMRKGFLLALIGAALAATAFSSSAEAHWWHHHYHHWYWHHAAWTAPTIYDVSFWWEHPYYYSSPYTVVTTYSTDWPHVLLGHVLTNHGTEIGPKYYPTVPVPAYLAY